MSDVSDVSEDICPVCPALDVRGVSECPAVSGGCLAGIWLGPMVFICNCECRSSKSVSVYAHIQKNKVKQSHNLLMNAVHSVLMRTCADRRTCENPVVLLLPASETCRMWMEIKGQQSLLVGRHFFVKVLRRRVKYG